jgi:LacI family transcriptional regulator
MPPQSSTSDDWRERFQLPLTELCCVNPGCPDYGKRNAGNLAVRAGKYGGRWRSILCTTCRQLFSERKGTPLWGTRMSPQLAEAIAQHLTEGCGIRKTARLTGASKDGVTSLALRLGIHAKALHDDQAKDLEVREVQADEKWSFVEKKTEPL